MWFWRKKGGMEADVAAVTSAEQEREYSQRRLDEARPRIELLRRLRREDHVGPLLDSLVQRRGEQGR